MIADPKQSCCIIVPYPFTCNSSFCTPHEKHLLQRNVCYLVFWSRTTERS